MIYFIQSGTNGPVKIGYSAAGAEQRLANLQTGSAAVLRIVGLVNGSRKDEAEWHRRFAHLRIHGEWFKWAPELRRAARPHLNETRERKWRRIVTEWAKTYIACHRRGFYPPCTNPDILAEIDRLQP